MADEGTLHVERDEGRLLVSGDVAAFQLVLDMLKALGREVVIVKDDKE